MKLSIVMPVYNVEKYIKKSLLSCINQKDVTDSDYEIIIVNDGTKDNSMKIVDEILKYTRSKCNVKIVNQENMGLSEARNTGLSHVSGDYVWFVDSDDWIDDDSVRSLIDILLDNDVDIIQMPYKLVYEDNTPNEIENVPEILKPISGKECMTRKKRLPNAAPSRVVKTSLLKEKNIKFIKGIYHEDAEFKPRLLYHAKRVITLNKPCYNYLKRTKDSITATFTIRNAEGRWYGVKSMYNFSENLPFKDKLIFNQDMNFNMYFVITGLNKLNKEDRDILITDIVNNHMVFKNMIFTMSPKKFLVYLMLYTCPKVLMKILCK